MFGIRRGEWLSLGGNFLSFLIGFSLEFIVFEDFLEESESRIGMSNVFNSNVDSLLDFSLFNLFVDDETN